MPLGTKVNLGPGDIVFDGGHSPPVLARVCCSQMAGWVKMPLGTEVDLGPGLDSSHICFLLYLFFLSYLLPYLLIYLFL